jgi:GNAT superfamily N-acetyltransferase
VGGAAPVRELVEAISADILEQIMRSIVTQAQSNAEYSAARALFAEYASTLGVDLGFQGFTSELNALESMYGPPSGCLLLARGDSDFVGCIGVRRLSADSCEMKRLYVRDAAREGGVGRALALAAIRKAKSLGYKRMLLDTLADMSAARRMYAALGFRECEPYRHNPIPGTMFMELNLDAEGELSRDGAGPSQSTR